MNTTLTNEQLATVDALTNAALVHLIAGGKALGVRALLGACQVAPSQIAPVLRLKMDMAKARYDGRMCGAIGVLLGHLENPVYLG